MINSILVRFAPWVLVAVGLFAGATYVQHINADRDTLADEVEVARATASAWQQQYQWQQAFAERLLGAMDNRTEALETATQSIDASRRALNRIGAEHAEIKEWMDRDLPGGIADWLRVLQQPGTPDDNAVPDDTGAADDAAGSAGG